MTRPPSQLAKLERSVQNAAPGGLPPAVRRFYAAGDGLTVTVTDGKRASTASIVGLREMFDGDFKPHKPVSKSIDAIDGRPFADRFFTDDFDFDAEGALERFNMLLRLKLVCSVPGESVDLAIDLFAPGEPALYALFRGEALRLELSFDDFVAWFSKLGVARWYFAFLEPAADDVLNIDVAKAFAASMRGFAARDVAPLRERLAQRTKAVAALRKRAAGAAKQAAAPKNIAKATIAELEKEVASAKYTLLLLGDRDALVAGIASKQLPPQAAWSYHEGLRVLPAELVPDVLAAPRLRTQDEAMWARVDQLVGVDIPPGAKLDAFLKDAVAIVAAFRGEKVRVAARFTKALDQWLYSPPMMARLPGTPEPPDSRTFKKDGDYLRALARHHRDRLAALGAALVGTGALTAALTAAFRATLYNGQRYAPGALLLVAKEITFDDLSNVIRKTDDLGLLLELAAAHKWTGAKVTAEAKRLEPRGFNVEPLRALAKYLR
jgi:hypothetical protein